jgi:hypothetical protein
MLLFQLLRALLKSHKLCSKLCEDELELFENELDFWSKYSLNLDIQHHKSSIKYYSDQLASLAA